MPHKNGNLSERDLLIELRTEVKNLMERFDKWENRLEKNDNNMDGVCNRLSAVETKVDENTSFRKWIYSALITSIASATIGVISLMAK